MSATRDSIWRRLNLTAAAEMMLWMLSITTVVSPFYNIWNVQSQNKYLLQPKGNIKQKLPNVRQDNTCIRFIHPTYATYKWTKCKLLLSALADAHKSHKPAFSRSSLVLHQTNECQENQQYSWFCHSTVLDQYYLKHAHHISVNYSTAKQDNKNMANNGKCKAIMQSKKKQEK